jgi:hypothetical protein
MGLEAFGISSESILRDDPESIDCGRRAARISSGRHKMDNPNKPAHTTAGSAQI